MFYNWLTCGAVCFTTGLNLLTIAGLAAGAAVESVALSGDPWRCKGKLVFIAGTACAYMVANILIMILAVSCLETGT